MQCVRRASKPHLADQIRAFEVTNPRLWKLASGRPGKGRLTSGGGGPWAFAQGRPLSARSAGLFSGSASDTRVTKTPWGPYGAATVSTL